MVYDGDNCINVSKGTVGIQRVGEEAGNETIRISCFTQNNVES